MPSDLTFYTHPMSRGRTVRWMLEECGATYDTVLLDYGTSMKADAYLAINPMGKVPALRHGNTVVTEAAAICTYLADLFPERQLAPPPASEARGAYYRWLFFAAGPMEAAFMGKSLGLLAPPDKASQVGYGSHDQMMETLESAVSQASPYLCGDRFTTADLYLGSALAFGLRSGGIDPRPAFDRYLQPLLQREACLRAAAIDVGLMQTQASPPQRP